MPPPVGQSQLQLEQLQELERMFEEEGHQLVQLCAALEQKLRTRNDGDAPRHRARNVHQRICDDDGGDHPPLFARASQNAAATAILLRTMPEPSTLDGRQAHKELCTLLEHAVVQQAESSTSRRHEPELDQLAQSAPREREAFVHPEQQKARNKPPSIHDRISNNAREIINVCKSTRRMVPAVATTLAGADATGAATS
jgi:hypothetical protein